MPFERLAIRLIRGIDYRQVFDNLAHDTFEGQILTCVIVVLFVAIFLLREWCMQNLPQQVDGLDFQPGPDQRAEAIQAREGALAVAAAAAAAAPAQPAVIEAAEPQVPLHQQELRQTQGQETQSGHEQSDDDGNDVYPQTDDLARNAEGSRVLRPRMQRGVPDPPELAGRVDEWKRDSRLEQAEGVRRLDGPSGEPSAFGVSADYSQPIVDTDGPPDGADAIPSSDEIRQRRNLFLEQFKFDHVNETNLPLNEEGLSRESLLADETLQRDTEADDKGKQKATEDSCDDQLDDIERALKSDGPSHQEQEEKEEETQALASTSRVDDHTDVHTESPSTGIAGLPPTAGPSTTGPKEEEDATSDFSESAHVGDDTVGHNVEEADEDDAEDGIAPNMNGRDNEGLDLNDWEEELENGERLEDDIEGMMEAIGMRGPFANLVTNITLMFVLCSFTLTVFVALPYMMGRLAGVGQALPRLLHAPFRAAYGISVKLLERERVRSIVLTVSRRVSGSVILHSLRRWSQNFSYISSPRADLNSSNLLSRLSAGLRPFITVPGSKTSLRTTEALMTSFKTLQEKAELSIGTIIRRTLVMVASLEARTRGVANQDRAFCIALGHAFWLIGLVIQSIFSDLYVRWNMRSLKTFVDQQLVVLKVLSFIILELVIFPLCCGILTDIALFPLWDGASLSSRFALASQKPFSLAFTQWSLGTLYMFGLAQFVAHTRSIVRPGVLCFVRDAGDPNFHPIRDILERRSLEQLRKIGVSGLIYSSILAVTLGLCSRAIVWCTTDVLPLRWNAHRTFSSTGMELVCIAVLMPIAIRTWLPVHWMRRSARVWWKRIARKLRLSSYLIGGRFPNEEGRAVFNTWHSLAEHWVGKREASTSDKSVQGSTFQADGGNARVPADDHAVMSSPLVILTDADGVPLEERGKEALQAQEEAISKLTRKPVYTVVYLPPYFRIRISAVVFALWATICVICLVGLLVPLLSGRAILDLLSWGGSDAFHDGFTWTIGLSTLLGAWSTMSKAAKMYRRLRVSSNVYRRIGKHAVRFGQRLWLIASLGFTTSLLLGVTIELYLNALTRTFTASPTLPDISLLHAMAAGAMEHQFFLEIIILRFGRTPDIDFAQAPLLLRPYFAFLLLRNGGWRRPKAWPITRDAVLPIVALYLGLLAAPFATLAAVHALVGRPSSERACALQISLVFLVYAVAMFFVVFQHAVSRRMEAWTDVIKDEHFLISTELKNYASHEEQANEDTATTSGAQHKGGNAREANGHARAEGPIPDALLHGRP